MVIFQGKVRSRTDRTSRFRPAAPAAQKLAESDTHSHTHAHRVYRLINCFPYCHLLNVFKLLAFEFEADVWKWNEPCAVVERKRKSLTCATSSSFRHFHVKGRACLTVDRGQHLLLKLAHFFHIFFLVLFEHFLISHSTSRPEDLPWRPAPSGKRSP